MKMPTGAARQTASGRRRPNGWQQARRTGTHRNAHQECTARRTKTTYGQRGEHAQGTGHKKEGNQAVIGARRQESSQKETQPAKGANKGAQQKRGPCRCETRYEAPPKRRDEEDGEGEEMQMQMQMQMLQRVASRPISSTASRARAAAMMGLAAESLGRYSDESGFCPNVRC